MANDTTINGIYTLPSLGKVYKEGLSPIVDLRTMTTIEEMKRLNHSDRPNASMAGIIDVCLVENPGISAYDMCLADYQFLLHKLRIVTYGSTYTLSSTCPYCNSINQDKVNLDEFPVKEFSADEFNKYRSFDLPKTNKHITLRMQTPRIMDDVTTRAKDQRRKTPNMVGDPAFLLSLETMIETINGERPDPIKLPEFIRNLPMMDTNTILVYAQKLNNSFGLETGLTNVCPICGLDYPSSFRINGEFFRPTIDI